MPSPFPGMDPYLELHWLDVHARLIAYTADSLNELLPSDLVAAVEERVAIGAEDEQGRWSFGPDVRVTEHSDEPLRPSTGSSGDAGVLTAPYQLLDQVVDDPITERYVRVIEASTERLVTVIEIVSPTNKSGDGLVAFRAKRELLVASGVSFVEVDLVREGNWRKLLRPAISPKDAGAAAYRITYRLPRDPGVVHFHPFGLREPLPPLQVPLRPSDPVVRIDLQPLVTRIYDVGRYARRLNYRGQLPVPLDVDDEHWADQLLRQASKR